MLSSRTNIIQLAKMKQNHHGIKAMVLKEGFSRKQAQIANNAQFVKSGEQFW